MKTHSLLSTLKSVIINFHPSTTETGNGTSDSFQQADLALVGLFVNVIDIQGDTLSLVVTLQHSPDNINWYNVGNIYVTLVTVAMAVASPVALALLADYVRIKWTFTGTNNPSVTFTADVVAHQTLT